MSDFQTYRDRWNDIDVPAVKGLEMFFGGLHDSPCSSHSVLDPSAAGCLCRKGNPMIKLNQPPIPKQRMCLICDRRPKAGTDDMCEECASLLARMPPTPNREHEQWSRIPSDRHRRYHKPRDGDDASPFQEHAIRMLEELGN